jgi:hypothetical protein
MCSFFGVYSISNGHPASQVELYYKRQPNTKPMPTQAAPVDTNSILSEFDRHQLTLLLGEKGEGWQAELHRYLKDMPANVTKDTDIVKWWQVRCPSALSITYF